LCVTFHNKLIVHVQEWLAQSPTPNLEDHPFSAVCGCLSNIFAATLHISRLSAPSATWGRATAWW
jgi:hypothetical protein